MEDKDLELGQGVKFRDGFSDDLRGLAFEVSAFSDGAVVHTAHESQGGYRFTTIRRRVGADQRWAYRLAKVSDLVNL